MNGIANEVTQIIDTIAVKLGVAAEKVYPMLLKQAEVFCSTYRITWWVAGVAVILLLVGVIGYLIANHDNWNEAGENVSCVVIALALVALVISGFVMLIDVRDYITALNNPEWWAIEYVTKLLK